MLTRTLPLLLLLATLSGPRPAGAQSLEAELLRTPAGDLAAEARASGDAARGGVVFFQHHMACSKCHSVGGGRTSTLGPDLAERRPEASDAALVEAVLTPSKTIREGYESVIVETADGRTLHGLPVERTAEALVIRDVARGGELTTLAAGDIEEVRTNPVSIMPTGQVNQLTSRQQFLDLIRYLIEVQEGGPLRAAELQPSPTLLTLEIPEYEQHVDHAGLIREWNEESYRRGERIYRRVCQNCHGTREEPGSLPTSLRFAEGRFKNGSDPLAIYQTLTRGFGMMAAQTWMVPVQKYDVIHYIREAYLRPHNPSQLVPADDSYLAGLPRGTTRGPAPSRIEPWSAMDYGPSLTHTYEIPGGDPHLAYKGIAVRLDPGAGGVSRGRRWMLFEADTLRVAAAWSAAGEGDNFIDWRGIQFNGEHQIHPTLSGRLSLTNGVGPGWAKPGDGSFTDDQRVEGRDGRRYGPLPRRWAQFQGLYHHEQDVVLAYTVGTTDVLESPRWLAGEGPEAESHFVRILNVGPRETDLVMRVADESPGQRLGVLPTDSPATLIAENGQVRMRIPKGDAPLRLAVWASAGDLGAMADAAQPPPAIHAADLDLARLTRGGPPRWPQRITTLAKIGGDEGPFAADVLTAPESNPWLAQTRFTGLDFFSDGRLAACTWDGDVWVVESEGRTTPGADPLPTGELRWQRIASGLFQPLGLRIVDDRIHLTCRDQLAVLHDLNGDGEIDFYECLNNDHQVTEHFHEFAMGLQTDAEGNFYYAKSARHALPAVVPHHGTLLRVSRDGSTTTILANGFRAANGVCLNPDGSFVVTDQEGHWNPKNRINWVTLSPDGRPKFYGNMFGHHDVVDASDEAMEPPLCWITNAFDRSPGELLWVDSDRWGALNGSLLNLSYGYGKVFLVPHETVAGRQQGGMIELPIPSFPTGVMRGRFHPDDGQLYLCGMFAWAGSATQPGGLYRLRATGRPMHLPTSLRARKSGLDLTFTDPLDADSLNAGEVRLKTWSLRRTENYGSDHVDEREIPVDSVALSDDCRTLTIRAAIQPTWCMEVRYVLRTATGEPLSGTIHNTIHDLGD
ncbi:MAG: c-type cytochrome [Planctomyces sp.]|nr:c-type cytochrome [Planctomyces sp.]